MKPYLCRFSDLDGADLTAANALCDHVQQAYWTNIKEAVAWSPSIITKIRQMTSIVAEDKGQVIGFMLMKLRPGWKPPTVDIVAMAALHTLTEREQLCAAWSMLLFGHKPCQEGGIQQGQGQITGPNDPLLEVFRRVKKYHVDRGGTGLSIVPAETNVHTWHLTVSPLDERYRQALEDAIEEL